MSLSHTDVPIHVDVRNDASDGFLSVRTAKTFARAGAVVINYDDDDQQFHIDFSTRDELGPLIRKPAIIDLTRDGVFHLVQDCRRGWEEALASITDRVPLADGNSKTVYQFEEFWDQPVNDESFKKLAARLAVIGNELFVALFERDDPALHKVAQKLRRWASSGEAALTIQGDKFHVPWRMLYTHPEGSGELAPDGSNFQPQGFWGYQHILEQFPATYELPDFRLIAKGGVLSLGAALHEDIDKQFRVGCVSTHREFVTHCGNRLTAVEWTDVTDVKAGLSSKPFPHQIIYFLCHAEGAGTEGEPNQTPWLQIAKAKMNAGDVRKAVKDKFGGNGPLVFLNACRAGLHDLLTSHNFSFASEFLKQGAKGFLGAQIELPAIFAGQFGRLFFERMMTEDDRPQFVGYVLRDITRDFWKRRNPLPLVYTLYAGADCHIVWDRETK
jgi:hypothetical protein